MQDLFNQSLKYTNVYISLLTNSKFQFRRISSSSSSFTGKNLVLAAVSLVLCTALLSCTGTALLFKMAAQDIRISKDQV